MRSFLKFFCSAVCMSTPTHEININYIAVERCTGVTNTTSYDAKLDTRQHT